MASIGFCGLGQMGSLMAGRLVDAGHDVAVWNRTAGRTDQLVERGARAAGSPAETASSAEAVITMLADPKALNVVVFGHDGVAAGLGQGSTLIEMSTVGPDVVHDVASMLGSERNMLDAPVLGSTPQAENGELKIFVGGAQSIFERWQSMLDVLGTPSYLGALGAGASMKLVANSTLGGLMATLGEALALADRLGLEQGAVLDVLAGSPIGVTVKSKREKIETQQYTPNFKLSLAVKDVRLVQEAAEKAGLEPRIARAALAALTEAESNGLGPLDYSAVVAHLRGLPANG